MSKSRHRVVIRSRVPEALAETLRAIAEARGETLARLIEQVLVAAVEASKNPAEGDAQA